MKIIICMDDTKLSPVREDGEYCCERMRIVMESRKYDMYYDKQFSHYLCERRDRGPKWSWDFCPFCGKSIKSKSEQYDKVLLKEFGISTKEDGFNWNTLDERLPNEFKTDEWWKKRGL